MGRVKPGLRRFQDAGCLAVLLAAAVLFLFPAWRQPDSFWYAPGATFSDLMITHWPNAWFVNRALREHGQIPLWRPLIMGGAPFAGNPLSALFYPPNWLLFLFPVPLAFHLTFGLVLLGAGAAFYGLVRWSYRRSSFAALVAGLGYMLTPKLIAHMGAGHMGLSQAFAWLPLLLWLLRSALERRRGCRAACCGVALAFAFFADPRVAFYGALMLGSYALYRLIGLWRGEGWRAAASMTLCLLLVPAACALAGAVQILPTLELMAATTRGAQALRDAGYGSLPWRYLAGYLLADQGGYHEWMTYLGLAPLGLAVLALWRGQGAERWFWAGLAVAALLFSLGVNAPLYPLIYRLWPGLGWVRVPSRALLLVALAMNLLAAWGGERGKRGKGEKEKGERGRVMQLAVAGLFVCGGLAASMRLWTGQSLLALAVVLAAVGAGLVGLLCMAARRTVLTCLPSLIWQAILTRCDARQPLVAWSALHLGTVLPRLPSLIWQAILAALLVADLWTMGYSLFVLRPAREVWAEGRDVAAYLAAQERPFRVYSPSYSLPQHTGAFFGLEQLDGVDPSQLRWTAHYMALAGRYQVAGYGVIIPFFPEGADVRTAWQGVTPDATLLGLLNGQFVVSAFPIATVQDPDWALRVHLPGGYIYENRRCLPRAFTVARAEAVAGWQEAQARLAAGFDPAGGALVEGGTPLSGPPGCQEARVTHISPNRIVVEAEVSQAALLVLGEVWYPGWRVEVDGVAQPLYRVDGIVRGTYLEPGAHVVTWTYEPASVRWGAGLSLAAVCCLVGYGVVSFVQRRGSRGSG